MSIFSEFDFSEETTAKLSTSFDSEIASSSIEESIIEYEYSSLSIYMNILIKSISCILSELIELNSSKSKNNFSTDDIFNSSQIPNISILVYLKRIVEYTNIEENTLICALIYIDTIAKKKTITNFNIHKILFSAILASIKFNEDKIYQNSYYSQIAGISTQELFKIENEFLNLIQFKLYIDEDKYLSYKLALETSIKI